MAKTEKLSINSTPETIFIGVGGIGSGIVGKVAERCRPGEDENIRFVTMDTNANDIKDIKNLKRGIVSIQTSSTRTVLDYLKNDKDARYNWFPNNTTLYPKTVSEGAGQVRAISRLALNATIQSGEIQKLYKAIDSLFLKDGGELKQALRVVIVSSASGGTGSGIAMIVGMLVRNYLSKHYRDRAAIIRGFLVMPGVMETVIKTDQEIRSQYRNGYATIKEINAFMMKASGFCDVQKELERYKDLHVDVPTPSGGVERLENLPFDFCYLLEASNQNQEGLAALEQYKEFAAQSLYEQMIGPMQKEAFGQDDNIIKEFGTKDNYGRNRFGGIGASIIRYPYDDIVDYVAYKRAMEVVGNGTEAGKWLSYDRRFREKEDEYKKNRETTTDNPPKLEIVYTQEFDSDESPFGKGIKRGMVSKIDQISGETQKAVETFLNDYISEIKGRIDSSSEMADEYANVKGLKGHIDYAQSSDPDLGGSNLGIIRSFLYAVDNNVSALTKTYSSSILRQGNILGNNIKEYHLESLLTSLDGPMHPNAMRYMLYKLTVNLRTELEEAIDQLDKSKMGNQKYEDGAEQVDRFNIPGLSKEPINSFPELVALEGQVKGGAKQKLWDAFNDHFPAYSKNAEKYYNSMIRKVAFEELSAHVARLTKEYEAFYKGFTEKVVLMSSKCEEIIEKLKFKKGDSIKYVCAEQKHLERFAELCNVGNNGLILPAKLNAKLFEAIKENAEIERIKSTDPEGVYEKTNVFDSTLLGYFRDSVEEDSSEILDLNIIRAIGKETKFDMLEQNKEKCSEQENKTEVDRAKEEAEARERALQDKVRRGERLASPGVAISSFNEPRNVSACAFNECLNEMKDINIKETIQKIGPSPVPSNAVSKYDLRFFCAYYDITADKLARFKSKMVCEDRQYNEEPGIYCDAYQEHMRKIGPDSTKCSAISVHIDKRWDSLTELPEVSLQANYEEILNIHKALIYGVIHNMIKLHRPSVEYDRDKLVFVLEDEDGENYNLTVSNGTDCDEFYEVLDALYRDRATVAKIFDMTCERRLDDENSNCKYMSTGFASDLAEFEIGLSHKGKTSIFEIPLLYFNSLPRAKMDDNELSIMIDAVIRILEEEISRFELASDRSALLTETLKKQFELLITNFQNDEFNKDEKMRKYTTLEDNYVINMTLRKLCNKIKELGRSDAKSLVVELKNMVKADKTVSANPETV